MARGVIIDGPNKGEKYKGRLIIEINYDKKEPVATVECLRCGGVSIISKSALIRSRDNIYCCSKCHRDSDGQIAERWPKIKRGGKNRIPDAVSREIVKARHIGVSVSELTEKYRISKESVYRIIRRGERRAEVDGFGKPKGAEYVLDYVFYKIKGKLVFAWYGDIQEWISSTISAKRILRYGDPV
jgi:transposase-like protein